MNIGDIVIEGDAHYNTLRRVVDRKLAQHIVSKEPLDIAVQPGMGIVAYTKLWCEENGIAFMEVRTPMLALDEFDGIPYIDPETREIKYAETDYHRVLNLDPSVMTVVMFDEFKAASPKVQTKLKDLRLDNVLFIHKSYTAPKNLDPDLHEKIKQIITSSLDR